MRGRRAELAEVVGRANDPVAEMVLPDAVDHHARGERMLGLASHVASSRRPLPCLIGG
jgi:hypothetical protein